LIRHKPGYQVEKNLIHSHLENLLHRLILPFFSYHPFYQNKAFF
jgi:hypothetical protein